MKHFIYIKVDTNDGDYVGSLKQITEEDLKKIMPLIEAIRNFEPYTTKITGKHIFEDRHENNYPVGDCLRRDLGEKSPEELYDFPKEIHDLFMGYCPSCEYGFHTIKEVKIFNESPLSLL